MDRSKLSGHELIERVLREFPVADEERRRLERMDASFPAADDECRLRAALYWYHPRSWVDAPYRAERLCFNPPSEIASTASWIRFRDTLLAMLADQPEDPEYLAYLKRVADILAWRALIPLEHRFWKAD